MTSVSVFIRSRILKRILKFSCLVQRFPIRVHVYDLSLRVTIQQRREVPYRLKAESCSRSREKPVNANRRVS